jgi:hypothetical protein
LHEERRPPKVGASFFVEDRMLRKRVGWLVVAMMAGCGGGTTTEDAGTPVDTGPSTPDANRDAFTVTGDPFDNYETALTNARTQECECTWMEQGFKSRDACVRDQLTNGDLVQCAEMGYAAARSASASHYTCVTPALQEYVTCRMRAGCADDMAVGACVETVNTALGGCDELPMEAQDAFDACFQDMVIGTGVCPETDAPWMGTGTFSGDTTRGGNESNPDTSCFADGMIPDTLEISPDRSHRWIAPAPGAFVIDTVGTEFDTILYVRSACGGANLACSDDIDTMAEMFTSRVTVNATMAGQEFIIVVDGYTTGDQGPFTVNVAAAPMGDAGTTTSDAGPATTDDAAVGMDAGM